MILYSAFYEGVQGHFFKKWEHAEMIRFPLFGLKYRKY